MKVLKFGGTSVRDAARIETVARLVASAAEDTGPVAVVVSALAGTTDALEQAADLACRDLESALEVVAELQARHVETASTVAGDARRESLLAEQNVSFGELRETLRGIALIQECSKKTLDRVLSHGERWSAPLVAAAISSRGLEARAVDARRLIVTDDDHGDALVLTEPTFAAIQRHFSDLEGLAVMTGFLGATQGGDTTTLGRGGSDLTAAILGAALGAQEIQIWTDVDGVLSADPRIVPQAFSLEEISYEELLELSHFGAEVVYPPTIGPARRAGIPLLIKNTLAPDFAGTRVVEQVAKSAKPGRDRPVTGISSIPRVSLMRLEGDSMVAVPGIGGRLFAALAAAQISVILISQASSEHSICFAVPPGEAERARVAIAREFALELDHGLIEPAIVEHDQSVIAVVGEGMRERAGISGRLFAELGRRGVSVRAISQGSSELNISLVVDHADQRTAVRSVHDSFFRDLDHRLEILVAGAGRVGSALLRQLRELENENRLDLEVSVCGLFNSTHQWLEPRGVDLAAGGPGPWRDVLDRLGEPVDRERLVRFLRDASGQRVLVDCTASSEMTGLYLELLRQGVIVVSANKLPFAGALADYRDLLRERRSFGRGLYFEATVGAGLPVLRTLRSIVDSGDRLRRLEGTMSGTLGLLIAALRRGEPFSAALRSAHEGGYTEPDPREDLSGRDVARKLLILGRAAGHLLEAGEIEVEPMIDVGDPGEPLERFWDRLAEADRDFADRQQQAAARGQALVYRAVLEEAGARVGLEEVPADDPLAQVSGSDNLFAFHTERYSESPLVLRGPGAGTEVTAGGVLSDLLQAHAEATPAAPLPRPGQRGGDADSVADGEETSSG